MLFLRKMRLCFMLQNRLDLTLVKSTANVPYTYARCPKLLLSTVTLSHNNWDFFFYFPTQVPLDYVGRAREIKICPSPVRPCRRVYEPGSYADFFHILVVGYPGPHARAFLVLKKYFLQFFMTEFSSPWSSKKYCFGYLKFCKLPRSFPVFSTCDRGSETFKMLLLQIK